MDVGPPECAHLDRVEGVCSACGDCLHEVVLNGACFYCGATELDPVERSPKPASDFVPIRRLGKTRENDR